jgi:hypothetical protein
MFVSAIRAKTSFSKIKIITKPILYLRLLRQLIHRFNAWKLGFTPISTVELDKVLRCYPKMDDAELLSFEFKYGFLTDRLT